MMILANLTEDVRIVGRVLPEYNIDSKPSNHNMFDRWSVSVSQIRQSAVLMNDDIIREVSSIKSPSLKG